MAPNPTITWRRYERTQIIGSAVANTRNGVNTPYGAISTLSHSTEHGLLSFFYLSPVQFKCVGLDYGL